MERGERNGWGRDRGTERAGRVNGRGLTGNERGREEWTGEGGRKGERNGGGGRKGSGRDGRSRESNGQKEGGMESEGRRGRREREGGRNGGRDRGGREGGKERRGEGRCFQHCSPDFQGEALANDHFAYRFEVANSITCNSVM